MSDKPKQVWGRRSAEFYADLQGKRVRVCVTTGKVYAGTLVGVDVYDIIIRQDNGTELLLPKGNIVYVAARGAGADGRKEG